MLRPGGQHHLDSVRIAAWSSQFSSNVRENLRIKKPGKRHAAPPATAEKSRNHEHSTAHRSSP